MTDQKPDRQDGDGLPRCNRCPPSTVRDDGRCLDCPRRTAHPTRDGAEGAREVYNSEEILATGARLLAARTVPPKPTPDAMREALKPFAQTGWLTSDTEHTGRTVVAHMHPESEREIILSSDDFHRAARAYAALSAPVPPADGATHIHNAILQIDAYESNGQIGRKEAAKLRDMLWCSPSPAVAAELATIDPLSNHPSIAHKVMLATPHVMGDREAIANVCYEYGHYSLRDVLLEGFEAMKFVQPEKAVDDMLDAILSLSVQPGAGEREAAIEECAKVALNFKYSEETKAVTNGARTYGNDEACEKIAAAILRKLTPSRQAPRSSSEDKS